MTRIAIFGAIVLLAGSAPCQDQPSQPTFRAGTELIQVSVVAQEKAGKPVRDLKQDDFQIFDNGAQQKIALFLAEGPKPEPEVTTPPGVFTNRIATDAGTGYSALLFDNLNADPGMDVFGHTSLARQKALKAIKAVPPGDRIAIYSLWCRFQVVREFTSDRDSLIQQLEKFIPASADCVFAGNGPQHVLTEQTFIPPGAPMPANLTLPPPVSHAEEGQAGAAARIKADIDDEEVKQLAEHLAGIPGRKKLLWLTTDFRLKPSNLRMLINANVAIYPVDTMGSIIGLPGDKEARYAPIRALAAMTGGMAYVDRDDLDMAMTQALNDGRASYTLGFYRPEENRNAAVHRIEVKTGRADVLLRYRTSYSVDAPRPKNGNPVQDLVDALNRPVNATAIGMIASALRVGNKLNLDLTLDIPALELQQKNGLWEGQAELIARFMTNDGKIAGKINAQTITFHLRPATYATALQQGLRFHRQIDIPAKAADLNLLVGNLGSGKIGTLTIPLAQVHLN